MLRDCDPKEGMEHPTAKLGSKVPFQVSLSVAKIVIVIFTYRVLKGRSASRFRRRFARR